MARLQTIPMAAGVVKVAFTDRTDGDFRVDRPGPDLDTRRSSIIDRPWTWLRQVHGNQVVAVSEPGDWAGSEADGSVTVVPGCPLAVTTADCAPVVLVAERGLGVVHAGWRGIASGVISQAADRLRTIGGEPVATLVGPSIGPAAYEFGGDDLDHVASVLGDEVRSSTTWGTPALDVGRAVALACERVGWPAPSGAAPCTSDNRWYSHRTRGDEGRQATVAWIAEA